MRQTIEKLFDLDLSDILQDATFEMWDNVIVARALIGGIERGRLDVGLLVGIQPPIHPRGKIYTFFFGFMLFNFGHVFVELSQGLVFICPVKGFLYSVSVGIVADDASELISAVGSVLLFGAWHGGAPFFSN